MDDIKIGLIIAQMINFWILFFLFKKFLADKLITAIAERRKQIQNVADLEASSKETLEKANTQAEEILKDARDKALTMEKDAESLAKKTKEEIISKADMEAKNILDNARGDIEKEKLSMMGGLKSKVVDLSLKLNGKLFEKETANKDFMEKELKSL